VERLFHELSTFIFSTEKGAKVKFDFITLKTIGRQKKRGKKTIGFDKVEMW
jgi:hypothetical protein